MAGERAKICFHGPVLVSAGANGVVERTLWGSLANLMIDYCLVDPFDKMQTTQQLARIIRDLRIEEDNT